jgi:hypothetical protein
LKETPDIDLPLGRIDPLRPKQGRTECKEKNRITPEKLNKRKAFGDLDFGTFVPVFANPLKSLIHVAACPIYMPAYRTLTHPGFGVLSA